MIQDNNAGRPAHTMQDILVKNQVKSALKNEPDPLELKITELVAGINILKTAIGDLDSTIWSLQSQIKLLNNTRFQIQKI